MRRAKGIVFAISDPLMTRRGVKAVKELIPEEFETSIEIFTRVLAKYYLPRNIIDAQVKVLRSECYGMLRGACSAIRPITERIVDLLAAGTAETFYVGKEAWPAAKTLGTLDLRGRTGATMIAIVRGEESFTSPGAEFEVREQDTLILVASHRDIDRAFRYLTIGETDDPGSSNGGA